MVNSNSCYVRIRAPRASDLRISADPVEGVFAALRTTGNFTFGIEFYIRLDLVKRGLIAIGLMILKRPLIYCGVKLSETVDARISIRCDAMFPCDISNNGWPHEDIGQNAPRQNHDCKRQS